MRIIHATGYSQKGLRAAWQHEEAFRQEAILAAILLPTAFWLARPGKLDDRFPDFCPVSANIHRCSQDPLDSDTAVQPDSHSKFSIWLAPSLNNQGLVSTWTRSGSIYLSAHPVHLHTCNQLTIVHCALTIGCRWSSKLVRKACLTIGVPEHSPVTHGSYLLAGRDHSIVM